MRTQTKIYVLLSFYIFQWCISSNLVFADDLSDVATRVASIQATDPLLPSGVTDPKWMIGFIISKVFLSSGKIKNAFVEGISGLTSNYVPRYNGTSLVNSSIYDDGTSVGIGTASPGTSKLNIQQTGANIAITAQTAGAQWVYATSTSSYGVQWVSSTSIWVIGQSTSGQGLYGSSTSGIWIQWVSTSAQWVYATSSSHYWIHGVSTSNIGVVGQSSGAAQWVYGQSAGWTWVQWDSTSNYGIYGTSSSNLGVYGYSTSSYGVYGQSPGNYGLVGRTTNASYGWVLGYNSDASVYGILWYTTGWVNYSTYGNSRSMASEYKFTGQGTNSWNPIDTYGIYQEAGAWSGTYPDLIINYTTGIKIWAYSGYGGTRFFNNAIGAGGEAEIMSIGNTDNDVRIINNLRVPFIYDSDNTWFYLDPNATSVMNQINASIIYDRDNTAYYLDPNNASNVNYLYRTYGYNGPEYDVNNTAYYVDPNNVSVFQDVRSSIFYDRDNTGYYMDPNGTSVFNQINSLGQHFINNTSPTIYLQDSDQKSAMLHNNSNQFYILSWCGVNSTTWCINGSYWPMDIDLNTDQMTLGWNLWVPEGGVKTTCVWNCF